MNAIDIPGDGSVLPMYNHRRRPLSQGQGTNRMDGISEATPRITGGRTRIHPPCDGNYITYRLKASWLLDVLMGDERPQVKSFSVHRILRRCKASSLGHLDSKSMLGQGLRSMYQNNDPSPRAMALPCMAQRSKGVLLRECSENGTADRVRHKYGLKATCFLRKG